MGKRSDFPRNPRDYYITPESAVLPLIPHLKPGVKFDEPFAGNGALVDILERHGMICVGASDIEPQRSDVEQFDALEITDTVGEMFITNSPWDRDILHPSIVRLSDIAPTWMLFDADWMHTLQAAPYLERCRAIVSVGRVKWIEGSTNTGKDNAAWYHFDTGEHVTEFFGR